MNYDSDGFGDLFSTFVAQFSSLSVERDCTEADNDSYALWEIGVPVLTIVEHNSIYNTHYDDTGDDTLEHIDFAYLSKIAQVSTAFIVRLAGIDVIK